MTAGSTGPFDTGVDLDAPLNTVHHSHDVILGQLSQVRLIAPLANEIRRVATVAAETVALFDHEVARHHADEERDLFPAVIRLAQPGEERDWATAAARELEAQHREIEKQWKDLQPQMRAFAQGRPGKLDIEMLAALIDTYEAHAKREEADYLPRAQAILARDPNHLAALGIAFHMRRTRHLPGYV